MKFIRDMRNGVIGLATVVFIMGWVVVLPLAMADRGFVAYDAPAHTYTIRPTGGDDTANIQAAFDGCVASGLRCTIQLAKGTFHTAQIVAYNFKGNFRGAGERWTVIEALPDLPVTTVCPYYLNPPSHDNPWPNLFTFLAGAFTVSDMTINEPHATPTKGWQIIPDLWNTALQNDILVTGEHADIAFNHVTFIGAQGDSYGLGVNTYNGIYVGAFDPAYFPPMQAEVSVTASSFYTIQTMIGVQVLVGSHVTVRDSTFDTNLEAFFPLDISDSVLEFSHNVVRHTVLYNSVYFAQNVLSCQKPSRITVTDNELHEYNAGWGITVIDFADINALCERSLDAVATRNVIYGGDATDTAGIAGLWPRSMVVVGNEIRGTSEGVIMWGAPGLIAGNEVRDSINIGIWLDASSSVLIKGNEIKDSGQLGIALTSGSSGNSILHNEIKNSGAYDLYWDQTGSGNFWEGNECMTSSPPGLCVGH